MLDLMAEMGVGETAREVGGLGRMSSLLLRGRPAALSVERRACGAGVEPSCARARRRGA
jgi:hypothetical protein